MKTRHLFVLLFFSRTFAFESHATAAATTARANDTAHTIRLPVLQFYATSAPKSAAEAANRTLAEIASHELLVAAQIAVDDINNDRYAALGNNPLPGYTLELQIIETGGDASQVLWAMSHLLDPQHNPTPPLLILGLLDSTEAEAVLAASQPWQTPVLTWMVSEPSLSAMYPNLNRYVATDMFAGLAALAMFNAMGWKSVSAIYTNDGGGSASELVSVVQRFGSQLTPGFVMNALAYELDTNNKPDVSTQLEAIRASGARIVLLSAYPADVLSIMQQADALGMINGVYQWAGTGLWCYESALWGTNKDNSQQAQSRLFDGVMCLEGWADQASTYYTELARTWAERYAADPASTRYLPTMRPQIGPIAYDLVYAAAKAIEQLLVIRSECGLPAAASNLTQPSAYALGMYGDGRAGTGATYKFAIANVPFTAPLACPYLEYQVGQGRVLSQLVRNLWMTWPTGTATGTLLMVGGDRIGNVALNNIYGGIKTEVGRLSVMALVGQLDGGGSAVVGVSVTNSSSSDLSSKSCVALETLIANLTSAQATALGYVQIAKLSDTGATTWRDHNNRSSTGFDAASSLQGVATWTSLAVPLRLSATGQLSANVFCDYQAAAMRFADGTNQVPLDRAYEVQSLQTIAWEARVGIYALVSLVAAYTLALMAFQLYFSTEKLVKITSPVMNCVFLVGALGVLAYVVLLSLDSEDRHVGVSYVDMCRIKFAVLSVAYSVAFGALFSKTYRIHVIFNSRRLNVKHSVRDMHLLLIVSALVCVDAILLSVWQAASPMERKLTVGALQTDALNHNLVYIPTIESCSNSQFTGYVACLLSYKGAVMACGLYLAGRVRTSGLDDAKWIAMATYNIILVALVLISVALMTAQQPTSFYLIISIGLVYLVLVVVSLLFVPRVMQVVQRHYAGTNGGNVVIDITPNAYNSNNNNDDGYTNSNTDNDKQGKSPKKSQRQIQRNATIPHPTASVAPMPP